MQTHLRHTACAQCPVRCRCVAAGLPPTELGRFDNLIEERYRIKRGRHLFRQGDAFQALYAVKLGVFKTTLCERDGREQVTGFRMYGEILGLDGIVHQHHAGNAIALEDAVVCKLPYLPVAALAGEIQVLRHRLLEMMSDEIVRDHRLIMLLGSMNASERLAVFLMNLLERQHARGLSTKELILRMTRQEIASYLGIQLETVSRIFSRFSQRGLIQVNRRHIRVIDAHQLMRLAS